MFAATWKLKFTVVLNKANFPQHADYVVLFLSFFIKKEKEKKSLKLSSRLQRKL